jgi:hypothetical protein
MLRNFVRLAVLLTVAAASGCDAGGAGAPAQPRLAGQVVPDTEARHIAAERKGALSYLPGRVPTGFAFSRWTTTEDCGPCGLRLVVRFVDGHSDVTWENFWEDPKRKWFGCRHQAHVVGAFQGRIVSYRRHRGVETAWACVPTQDHQIISVSQRADSGHRVSPRDLEGMVGSARSLPPGRARGARYELPPRAATRQMAAVFGSPFFLPTRLPRGFISTRWQLAPHDFGETPRRTLFVTFARDGLLLEWFVRAGVDPDGFGCPKPETVRRTFVVKGRRVYFADGIHGASARACVPRHAVGNAKPLEIELWYDIRLDSPRMRRLAARMVGTARLVRG